MDALVAVAAVAALVYGFRKVGLWKWFWLGLAGYLGVFELVAKWTTGKTLSQQFWAYSTQHGSTAVALAALVAVGGIGLAVHLIWKWIKRK